MPPRWNRSSPRWGQFLRNEIAEGRRYLPAGQHVLRAFTRPIDDVRVLIVGQDPYPTPGHAVGLSFSVAPPDVRPLPRSLGNIYTEYCSDLGYPMPSNGDLTPPWADNGVLLLNRVLTVAPGGARISPQEGLGSGHRVRDQGARRARRTARRDPVGGKDAAGLQEWLPDVPTIVSAHPSPLSASRGFFGSRPFSRANEELEDLGADPVDWRLP